MESQPSTTSVESTSSDTTVTSARSLLEILKAPQASDLTRKRKVDCNPPVGKKRSRGQHSSEPKSISPEDRVKEFPMRAYQYLQTKNFSV